MAAIAEQCGQVNLLAKTCGGIYVIWSISSQNRLEAPAPTHWREYTIVQQQAKTETTMPTRKTAVEVLFEDAHVIAVAKPAGLAAIPGRAEPTSLLQVV